LATSLTGCLKVVGDYIPALGFLSIILGTKRLHEDYHDYYRRLLELDSPGARAFAIRYCDKNGLQRTFYDVLLPTLFLMGEERREERDSPEVRLIIDTSRQLVTELGNRFAKPPASGSVRVPGVMAPDDPHDLGLLTLIELLRQDGGIANLAGTRKTTAEICELVKQAWAVHKSAPIATRRGALSSATSIVESERIPRPECPLIFRALPAARIERPTERNL
jgi:hypothetical protein